jgi:50S ribosomal subunit-associated GTPase HflX
MPRQYPTGFRDEMVGRMLAGESAGSADSRAAHKRIKAFEQELQLVKDTSQIYDPLVVDPKGGRPHA